jgi:hypothetical protein
MIMPANVPLLKVDPGDLLSTVTLLKSMSIHKIKTINNIYLIYEYMQ